MTLTSQPLSLTPRGESPADDCVPGAVGSEDCCSLGGEPVSADEAEHLAARLKALSDPTRLQLLSHVAAVGCGDVCVCDLTTPLGNEAVVEPVPGMRGSITTWRTDEPSERGIEGIERMRLVRDDIDARVAALLEELTADEG